MEDYYGTVQNLHGILNALKDVRGLISMLTSCTPIAFLHTNPRH